MVVGEIFVYLLWFDYFRVVVHIPDSQGNDVSEETWQWIGLVSIVARSKSDPITYRTPKLYRNLSLSPELRNPSPIRFP